MIKKKKDTIKALAIHSKDVGSTEIQIGLLTDKISKLAEHFKKAKKDKHSSVGLTKSVNKRKKLLNYLKRKNFASYQKVIKELNDKNIKLNITAVYSAKQTKKILNVVNKKTKIIISIFAGRSADTGKDPVPEFKKSIKMAKKFKNVEILWASVREPYNYLQAKQLGCHIITIPPSIIEKIQKFGKSFDKLTIETVKAFLLDSKKSKFKI